LQDEERVYERIGQVQWNQMVSRQHDSSHNFDDLLSMLPEHKSMEDYPKMAAMSLF